MNGSRPGDRCLTPVTSYEIVLRGELLTRVAPERVLRPIAIDRARAWLVLPDGGSSLGERLSGDELADAMARAMNDYGQLQRQLAHHGDELLALGITDMRAPILPARFEQALEAVAEQVDARDAREDRAMYRRIRPGRRIRLRTPEMPDVPARCLLPRRRLTENAQARDQTHTAKTIIGGRPNA